MLSLYRWGPLLSKEYPIKYSLQWFLSKPPHGGFGNFFHWYLCRNRYGVPSLKMLWKVPQKKRLKKVQVIHLPLNKSRRDWRSVQGKYDCITVYVEKVLLCTYMSIDFIRMLHTVLPNNSLLHLFNYFKYMRLVCWSINQIPFALSN